MASPSVPGISAPTKQSPTSTTKPNRLPAPTLFVGPPSRNASQLSVSRAHPDLPSKSARPGAKGAKSTLKASQAAGDSPKEGKEAPTVSKASEKSIDAKWREMQNTLNEVELTAQSSTHVFGESHARALDELRQAQVDLAKAWGRGSEDRNATTTDVVGEMNVGRFQGGEDAHLERSQIHRPRAETDASVSTVLSDESQLSESSARSGRSQLEDETAQDIKLASERRVANEAYFKRVDEGVKEVVDKLERVADAMRGVEAESRSLWSSSERSSSEEGQNHPPPPPVSVP